MNINNHSTPETNAEKARLEEAWDLGTVFSHQVLDKFAEFAGNLERQRNMLREALDTLEASIETNQPGGEDDADNEFAILCNHWIEIIQEALAETEPKP